MGRKSPLAEIAETDAEMEMTPMIDVTFLLLIFFMCTIKFKVLEGKLSAYLPKDRGVNTTPQEPPDPPIEIKLQVVNEGSKLDPKGQRAYDPGRDPRFTYGPDRQYSIKVESTIYPTLDEAYNRLVALHTNPDQAERGVKIDAKAGIVYADVVQVLDRVIKAEFTEVTFEGSYE